MPVVFGVREDYNRGDKKGAVGVPLPKNDMENEKFVPKIDQIISDESKKMIDKFKEQSAARGLSDEEGIEIFREVMSATGEILDARLVRGRTLDEFYNEKYRGLAKKEGVVFESQPKPREPLTPPDLSEIPRWQGRKRNGMPLEFIEKHYGKWLSAFGAEENGVFQDQIREHDPKLLQGLKNQLYEQGKKRTVGEFIKPRSSRVDMELENIDPGYIRDAHRLKVAATRRKLKK